MTQLFDPDGNHARQEAFANGLITVACSLGALILAIGTVLETQRIAPPTRDITRATAGTLAIGLWSIGLVPRRRWRIAHEFLEANWQTNTQNAVAWTHMAGQPSRATLRAMQTEEPMSTLPLFDWSELADADAHPMLGLVGKMGSGKSITTKWLARHVLFPGQSPDIAVFDVCGRASDWVDCTLCVSTEQMASQMVLDSIEIHHRLGLFRQGTDNFPAMFRVFEEMRTTLPLIKDSSSSADLAATRWLIAFSSLTRKLKARALFVSTVLSAESFGMKGEVRDDITIIFPGRVGIQKAMSDTRILRLGTAANEKLRAKLQRSLIGSRRPALVYFGGDWHPACIPELDRHGNPIAGIQEITSTSTSAEVPPVPPSGSEAEAEVNAEVDQLSDDDLLQWVEELEADGNTSHQVITTVFGVTGGRPYLRAKERLEALSRRGGND